MGRVGKLNTTLSYGSRWKTQHNASYGSRWKLNTTLPMGRVVGWELSLLEDFVVIPTIDLEIQLFVGKVMRSYFLFRGSDAAKQFPSKSLGLPVFVIPVCFLVLW
ncbi:hypothetical protein LEP1GSC116_0053 [Leptospira interrogans serovar Icterohaemorrhagiae str. Verdun HP]|uniref:Uncharacterized protein n=1 Tax=Leptospira interrogans serovar Icterohaemorrhagiae str. Verdun HP TaxID=1049910 RepID=M6RRW4_LEPIR|nr:hypothetical protein LEP1GSC116_0053 [Leptospira interrogans serovar Icterohaemorrhagiae str. Verdun HP]